MHLDAFTTHIQTFEVYLTFMLGSKMWQIDKQYRSLSIFSFLRMSDYLNLRYVS